MPSEGPTTLAVVFDLDDTLYPERDYVRSGYRAVGAHLRQRLQRTEAFEDWLWGRFLAGESAKAFDALIAEFALDLARWQIVELVGIYRDHRPEIRLRGGVREALGRLRERCKLALLSDGFLPAQQLKLDALGLQSAFEAVVFTEEMGRDCWKPSPAGFEAVREVLDVPHEACAYVGDNLAKDFVAPNRLGWRTVRLLCEGQIHAHKPAPPDGEPDVTVERVAALEDMLF